MNISPTRRLGLVEFTILISCLTAILALGIDAVLPAIPQMLDSFALQDVNQIQWVVTVYMLGMGFGQLLFGPASDSYGRKNTIYIGMIFFISGSLICALTNDFNMMLIGRAIQGVGVAAPRVVTVSIVRDIYEGREMARVMSIIGAVFIMSPAVAPSLGAIILMFAHWHAIFVFILVCGAGATVWMAIRQPETLPPERRLAFRPGVIWAGVYETLSYRVCVGSIVTSSFVAGALFGYLGASQQIFEVTFDQRQNFPLYFGGLALCIGIASIVNSMLVMRFGMRLLSSLAALFATAISGIYLIFLFISSDANTLVFFMIWAGPLFFCLGIMFGNLFSIGMQPIGHIAGVGSAVIGSISTVAGAILGAPIGQAFDGTVTPIVAGFLVFMALTWLGIETLLKHSVQP